MAKPKGTVAAGLIVAATLSLGSLYADQWKETKPVAKTFVGLFDNIKSIGKSTVNTVKNGEITRNNLEETRAFNGEKVKKKSDSVVTHAKDSSSHGVSLLANGKSVSLMANGETAFVGQQKLKTGAKGVILSHLKKTPENLMQRNIAVQNHNSNVEELIGYVPNPKGEDKVNMVVINGKNTFTAKKGANGINPDIVIPGTQDEQRRVQQLSNYYTSAFFNGGTVVVLHPKTGIKGLRQVCRELTENEITKRNLPTTSGGQKLVWKMIKRNAVLEFDGVSYSENVANQ